MSTKPLLFVIIAALFSVAGDVALKRFGDNRSIRDLIWCLVLWEFCATAWVLAYLWRLPLGRTTAIGLLMVLTLNCIIGIIHYEETFTHLQTLGLGLGAASILLLVLG